MTSQQTTQNKTGLHRSPKTHHKPFYLFTIYDIILLNFTQICLTSLMNDPLAFLLDGVLLTRGPGAYKIPSFGDIPSEFNVSLLHGATNPKAVYSSKGIGEPPLFLSASVFFASRQAIKAARRDSGLEGIPFQLDSPLSAERIRMACEDHLTQKVPNLPEEGTYKPWGIQV